MSYFRPQTITFEAALRDLENGNDKARAQAAAALGDVSAAAERERAAAALIAATADKVSTVRSAAARSLGEIGDASAIEPLLGLLDDGAAPVRQVATIALGQLGLAAAFDPLAEVLTAGPPDVRFQAARSLVEIDPERALEPIAAALEGEHDAEVVGQLGLALGELGDDSVADALAARLGELEGEPRFEVAYGLARLGDRRAAEALAAAIGDRALSWDAIEGLEMIGGERAATALAGAMHLRRLAPELKLRAASALLAVAPDSEFAEAAGAALVDGLSAWRHHLRALAISELARVGGAWAVAPLERLATRRRGQAHSDDIAAAIEAIAARSEDHVD